MATARKPLYIDETDGKIKRFGAGDFFDAPDTIERTFTSTAVIGQAVFVDGNGSVDLARANAPGTSVVFGLAGEGVTATQTGTVVTEGLLNATTGQWDAVTGGSGGLTAGALYFLSEATAGQLLEGTPPSAAGESITEVGEAISTTDMYVRIRRPVEL